MVIPLFWVIWNLVNSTVYKNVFQLPCFSQQMLFFFLQSIPWPLLQWVTEGLVKAVVHTSNIIKHHLRMPFQFSRQAACWDSVKNLLDWLLQFFAWCWFTLHHQDGRVGIGLMVPCIGNDHLWVELFSNVFCDSIELFFGCDGESRHGFRNSFEKKGQALMCKRTQKRWVLQ